MSLGHCDLMLLKRYLVITILSSYISHCNCLDIFSKTLSNLPFKNFNLSDLKNYTSLENLWTLPKNDVFTAEEVSNNNNLYLEGQQNEDIHLNGTQLIQKYGYKAEEHHITTSDGYKLGLYRIPGDGPVVFIMHGLLCSYVDWLTVGPDQGIPYLLAAQGYDVWLGNARGNTFSRFNDHLSPSNPEFWDFSFNEIGSIDLPTMIDYILAKTGKKKLTYIGHSQGTTSLFVLCSTKPEYNDKIDLLVALSAVAFGKHVTNPLLQIAARNNAMFKALGSALGLNEVAPDNNVKKFLTLCLCGNSLLASIVCQNVLFLLVGFNYSQINYKQIPVMFNHSPSGSSLKQVEHYFQLVVSGYFRNFDYGTTLNLEKYGSASPPSYPLDKITIPIAIFYSQGDWLANPIDVENLRSKLKNVVDYYEVPLRSFNHMDFLWAKDVKNLVYERVLKLIKQNKFNTVLQKV